MPRGDVIRARPEASWKSDPQVEVLRRLPRWAAFHSACGARMLAFDVIERHGRGYRCQAMQVRPRCPGGFEYIDQGIGEGRLPLDALRAAFDQCGIPVPEAARMLAEDLGAVASVDEFAALLEDVGADEFADLL